MHNLLCYLEIKLKALLLYLTSQKLIKCWPNQKTQNTLLVLTYEVHIIISSLVLNNTQKCIHHYFGTFECLRMPFGLAPGPHCFIAVMQEVSGNFCDFCFFHIDDVMKEDPTKEHLKCLKMIFEKIKERIETKIIQMHFFLKSTFLNISFLVKECTLWRKKFLLCS